MAPAPSASAAPTRKWWAATVTGAAGILTLFATHGWHFDQETTIPLITIVSQRIIAYLIPNESER
jgi:hypothetical protein